MPAIDELALHLDRVDFAEGEDDVVQGERGDRFYVIADGEADVIGDGRPIRTLRPRDGFEEIARLHDMLRTTVRAHTPLRLYTLDRRHFLCTIAGVRRAVNGICGRECCCLFRHELSLLRSPNEGDAAGSRLV